MKKLTIIISLFLFSCGARKVDRRKIQEEIKTEQKEVVKNDVVIDSNTKIETKTYTDETNKEEIEETVVTPIDGNKPAIYGKDTLNNASLTKRKIKRNKDVKEINNTILSNDTKTADKTTKKSEKAQQAKNSEQTKNIDKKQFDIIGMILSYWWLWILIAIAIYLFKKYRKKIWFV